MLGDNLLQFSRISSNKLIDLRAVLENQKRGHSTDAVFLRDFGEFIDIDFEVICVFVLFTELDDLGSDHLFQKLVRVHKLTTGNGYARTYLTRTTPSSVEIDDRDALGDRVFELLARLDDVNHGGRGCVECTNLRKESWDLTRDAGCHCYSAQMQERVDEVFVDNGNGCLLGGALYGVWVWFVMLDDVMVDLSCRKFS
jgi:hypothetical protein